MVRSVVVSFVALAFACSRPSDEQRPPAPPASTPVAIPNAGSAPSASASTGAAGAPAGSSTAVVLEHCKAWNKKAVSVLATTREPQPVLLVEGDGVYVFGYSHNLARSALYRVSRAGGKLETVATRKGLGELQGFAFGGGAAYYAQRSGVFRLGPGVGNVTELTKGGYDSLALAGDRLFTVECVAKGPDRLLELPAAGGDAVLFAELPHASSERCDYAGLAADATDVFVADWRGSRVLAVSRADKSARELVTRKGFPSSVAIDGASVVLLGALGLLRVPRAGGDVEKLLDSEKVAAPFSSLEIHGGEYWLLDQLAYVPTTTLFRMPRASKTPRAVFSHHVKDVIHAGKGDTGVYDFAVDDECVYAAEWRFGQDGAQITARAKPE